MSSQSTHTKPEKTMRILYAYIEFRNEKGQPSPCRGFEHFEINLGKKYIQCHDACRGQWLRQIHALKYDRGAGNAYDGAVIY